jgi:hypothetical protein
LITVSISSSSSYPLTSLAPYANHSPVAAATAVNIIADAPPVTYAKSSDDALHVYFGCFDTDPQWGPCLEPVVVKVRLGVSRARGVRQCHPTPSAASCFSTVTATTSTTTAATAIPTATRTTNPGATATATAITITSTTLFGL